MPPSRPEGSVIQELLAVVHARHRHIDDGEVASYIPALQLANPDHFGICIVSTRGDVFEVGDSQVEFTIQSCSKALVYAHALSVHGRAKVLERVGIEPSGDAFNSIALDASNRAFNPMVNAGAITTAGFIEGADFAERRAKLLRCFSAAAGRELTVDETVYASEAETGHRNRALAWLVTNFDRMDPATNMQTLDLYFLQCSVRVTARDLAVMGATLANLGINPLTKENVFEMASVQDVLSVMATCGMYDYAGEWMFRVGIPAKSGVGGGILGVVNRQLGIGTYSPRLDARGNSVRGIKACCDLADDLGLHAFNFMNSGSHFLKHVI
ncbi:MAG: glutaminase A [Burkholderiaceae bacterium]|nr:glutaminase A [Burkholderiaceae bacterium]